MTITADAATASAQCSPNRTLAVRGHGFQHAGGRTDSRSAFSGDTPSRYCRALFGIASVRLLPPTDCTCSSLTASCANGRKRAEHEYQHSAPVCICSYRPLRNKVEYLLEKRQAHGKRQDSACNLHLGGKRGLTGVPTKRGCDPHHDRHTDCLAHRQIQRGTSRTARQRPEPLRRAWLR